MISNPSWMSMSYQSVRKVNSRLIIVGTLYTSQIVSVLHRLLSIMPSTLRSAMENLSSSFKNQATASMFIITHSAFHPLSTSWTIYLKKPVSIGI